MKGGIANGDNLLHFADSVKFLSCVQVLVCTIWMSAHLACYLDGTAFVKIEDSVSTFLGGTGDTESQGVNYWVVRIELKTKSM